MGAPNTTGMANARLSADSDQASCAFCDESGYSTVVSQMVMAKPVSALPITETDYHNAFDRHIGAIAEPLARSMALCREAGLAVIASGSGPSFFAPIPLESVPTTLLRELERSWGVHAIACHSLPRALATTMREV